MTTIAAPVADTAATVSRELGITFTETWLTVLTATGVYFGAILFSRVFGQRQFASSSSYDLIFVFALGSLIGRVVLVRTSLATALVGLLTLFLLHAATGWLHHNVKAVHDLIQNPPILLVAEGEVVEDGLRRAHLSRTELYQAVRLEGHGSLAGLRAVIMERTGRISVLQEGSPIDAEVMAEVTRTTGAGDEPLAQRRHGPPPHPTERDTP